MSIEEMLPIGTIVLLEDAKKPLMIFGVMQADLESGEEYDYVGVMYPEGNMGQDTQFFFMHENINKVVFRGYEDEDRKEFLDRIEEYNNDLKED